MDGPLFRYVKRVRVKRRQLLCERYWIAHQSTFTSSVAAATVEPKRDVIHGPRDIGGGQTVPHSSTFFFSVHGSSSPSASTVLLNIHAFILYVPSCNLTRCTSAVNNIKMAVGSLQNKIDFI